MIASLAVAVLPGCATCRHQAIEAGNCPEGCPDGSGAERRRVHTFLVGGAVPCDLGDLSGLRDRLNAAGFSKVYVGQVYHAGGFAREIRRIVNNDPGARFVLVGYDCGAAEAEGLAAAAAAHGAAVDGVMFLDPVYAFGRWACPPTRTVVIQSQGRGGDTPAAETVTLAGVGHLSLPTHPHTVSTLIGLLKQSVAKVPADEPSHPFLPLVDFPPPIPVLPATPPDRPIVASTIRQAD